MYFGDFCVQKKLDGVILSVAKGLAWSHVIVAMTSPCARFFAMLKMTYCHRKKKKLKTLPRQIKAVPLCPISPKGSEEAVAVVATHLPENF